MAGVAFPEFPLVPLLKFVVHFDATSHMVFSPLWGDTVVNTLTFTSVRVFLCSVLTERR